MRTNYWKPCIVLLLSPSISHHIHGEVPSEQGHTVIGAAVPHDNGKAREVISRALQAQDATVLAATVDHPNWDIKAEAVEALAKLPSVKAAPAYASILKKEKLWEHIKGGELMVVQDDFERLLKRGISQAVGRDLSAADLFDGATRENLIRSLSGAPR